jgi:hypothetical protein
VSQEKDPLRTNGRDLSAMHQIPDALCHFTPISVKRKPDDPLSESPLRTRGKLWGNHENQTDQNQAKTSRRVREETQEHGRAIAACKSRQRNRKSCRRARSSRKLVGRGHIEFRMQDISGGFQYSLNSEILVRYINHLPDSQLIINSHEQWTLWQSIASPPTLTGDHKLQQHVLKRVFKSLPQNKKRLSSSTKLSKVSTWHSQFSISTTPWQC